MRVAGYVRVSTLTQVHPQTLDQQAGAFARPSPGTELFLDEAFSAMTATAARG